MKRSKTIKDIEHIIHQYTLAMSYSYSTLIDDIDPTTLSDNILDKLEEQFMFIWEPEND